MNDFTGLPVVVKEIAEIMQLPKEIGGEVLITWKNIKAYELLEGHFYEWVHVEHETLSQQ